MTSKNETLSADTHFGFLNRYEDADQIYNPLLISNGEQITMLQAIKEELRTASSFTFSVAFISSTGLALLKQALLDFRGTGKIITSRYLDFNDPTMFRELLLLDNVETFIHQDDGFHPKGYVFQKEVGVTAIVGSSNLTDKALKVNQEWNLKFSASPEGDIAFQIDDAITRQYERSQPLTPTWIDAYEESRRVPERLISRSLPLAEETQQSTIVPNSMQEAALESLLDLTSRGEKRGVIISATGTGKTILAALAVRMLEPQRILFVVHREQILDRAQQEFQKVLEASPSDFGKVSGTAKQFDSKYVFGTIQTLSRAETLESITSDAFDLVIIDEVHRAGAESYLRLVNHLKPKFLLGLTATPERTDGFNVFELFDFNVPYEIRLQAALEANMLVPFHYYGVTDFVTEGKEVISDVTQLRWLVSDERITHILDALRKYGHPEGVKGLIFCSRKEEAYDLSHQLNERTFNGQRLRTVALTGDDEITQRERAVDMLEAGELDYILTVDIFNEGIDIPAVNQIVMLRSTQSSIVFTQQLGRGLRKAAGKDHLRVIDFIGNYANNYLIPIALFGDNSRNKDSIRRQIIDNETAGTISGVSSVNFDAIAQQRILESLNEAKLSTKRELKKDILQLQDRLNQLPELFDFARFETVDPVVIGSKYGNYWKLLKELKLVEQGPSDEESAYLTFLSGELLNGKRPHELLLLQELMEKPEVSVQSFQQLLEAKGTTADSETISSVERVLKLEFFTSQQLQKYGSSPVIQATEKGYALSPDFSALLETEADSTNRETSVQNFRSHVNDIIATGLFTSQQRGYWQGSLIVGERYSRKDVCRLLNWEKNNDSTIYGYKVDEFSNTCPIFVTYHKAEDVSDSTRYEDELRDPNTLHWFTRSRRTLQSAEVKAITTNSVPLYVFVKKDDYEGTDFLYLGQVRATNSVEEKMPVEDGTELPVVSMDLKFKSPVEQSLYDYLRSDLSTPSE